MTCAVQECGREANGSELCGVHQEQRRQREEVVWTGRQELIRVRLDDAGIQPFARRRLAPPDSSTSHRRSARKLRFW